MAPLVFLSAICLFGFDLWCGLVTVMATCTPKPIPFHTFLFHSTLEGTHWPARLLIGLPFLWSVMRFCRRDDHPIANFILKFQAFSDQYTMLDSDEKPNLALLSYHCTWGLVEVSRRVFSVVTYIERLGSPLHSWSYYMYPYSLFAHTFNICPYNIRQMVPLYMYLGPSQCVSGRV